MTPHDHVVHAVAIASICVIAGCGVFSLYSIGRDLLDHHQRLAEVWADLVERAAVRWHAVATLFPVNNAASAHLPAGSPLDTAEAGVAPTVEVR